VRDSDADSSWTVKIFKQAVVNKQGAARMAVRYQYAGRYIQDDATLDSLNVQPGSTIFQMADFSSRKAQSKTYDVKDRFGREHVVTIKDNKTVYDLKMKLWELTSEPPSSFSLWTNLREGGDGFRFGTILKDTHFLFNYKPDVIEMDRPYKSDKSKCVASFPRLLSPYGL
jgi:hypothetical protein